MHEHVIVGTGPSALAAAMALRRARRPFEVLDVGHDLEAARGASVARLAAQRPEVWSPADRALLFPPPRASTEGVEKRYAFGSDFPYRMPPFLEVTAEDCVVDVSHGMGGFGNVWGAAMLPYIDPDLEGWPVDAASLAGSYREVLRYVPASAESDELEQAFPLFGHTGGVLELSEQMAPLRDAIAARRDVLRHRGILAGRARVAVDASGGDHSCRYCGRCLAGCVYGSIFNPRNLWDQLAREGIVVRRGAYAVAFAEHPDRVDLTVRDLASGQHRIVQTRRLYLGTGALNTTRIVARSLGRTGEPIGLKDSQYFFFPMLSWRRARSLPSFTLAELFVEVMSPRLSRYVTHFQVYGLNDIFRQALGGMMPRLLRRPAIMRELEGRFCLFQGFLHSEHSGRLELTLELSGDGTDRVRIRGVPNPASRRIARGAQRLLRRQLIAFGVIPPAYLKMVPLGRSFHVGGSFPMGGADPVFRSDRLGRPAGLRRVHLLDASTFPTIPATTITLSIMANADRAVTETLERGGP